MKKLILFCTLIAASVAWNQAQAQQVGIKTNLLYDATGTFNLGAEFRLGKCTSLDVPINWNPFTFSDNRKWKHILVQPELRLWMEETFAGHFFGLHAHYAAYNVGNLPKPFSQYMRDHRFEGWLAGVGVSYGYRWNFSDRWGLEATVGVGYAYMDYDKFLCARCGEKIGSETKHYFGSTKAGISLIYNIGKRKQPAPALIPISEIPLVVTKEEPVAVVLPYIPQFAVSYVVPAAEAVKERSEAGKAYLDFAVGKSEIVPDFKGNAAELEKIYAMIREVKENPDATITGITITGYASPDGSYASNQSLSQRRAAALKNQIKTTYGIPESQFTVEGAGEDWATLESLVSQSEIVDRQAVLEIVRSDDAPDVRERKLAALAGGNPYKAMKDNLFPQLRRTEYELHYTVLPFTVEKGKEVFKIRPSSLSLNEMFLIANTYEPGSDAFNEVFETAVRLFPHDDVANLNAAASALSRSDLVQAERYLSKVKNQAAEYHNRYLSTIRFKGGNVKFNHGIVNANKYLTSIEVFDNTSVPVKKIVFSYVQPDKSGAVETKPSLLDKLTFINPRTGTAEGEEYRFSYYNAERYPIISVSQSEMESDWWGYYLRGGYNLIREDVPYLRIPVFERDKLVLYGPQPKTIMIGKATVDKNSNVEDMKTGMLKSIVYPAGGKTIFHYESNRYLSRDNISTPCGGLRIQKIENIPTTGKSEIKTYKYNPHLGGYGMMPRYLYPPDPRGRSKNFLTEATVENRFKVVHDGTWPDPNWIGGLYFTYARYLYSNVLPGQFSIFTSNTVYYDKVVEYWGTESANNGYTEHEYLFNLPEHQLYTHNFIARRTNEYNSRQFIHVIPPAYGENPSRLHKKTVYNTNGQPVEESLYGYMGFYKGSVYDMPIQQLFYYKFGGDLVMNTNPQYREDRIKVLELIETEYTDHQQFAWLHQEYRLGASRLTSETVKHHTANGVVTTVKTLEYDPKYLLPVKETISSTGSGETLSTTYKYPHQYTTQPYTNMVQRNILSPVIEKAAYKGTALLEKGITNYRLWGTDHYAPLNYQRQRQGASLETRLVYDYNLQSGHLQAAVKDGIQKVVYIRDACGQPVAVIDQADYSQVSNLLGATRIQRIANSFVVSSDDMAALNQLRTQLPDALVSTYVYKPLVGILTATAPSGIVTRYEYDDLGRLKHIVDQDGHLVEKYEYNYVNQ